jgi:hypothetical protein
MASMWILNADESPIEASKSGSDKVFVDNVCIDILNGSCYVTLFHYYKFISLIKTSIY